MARRILLLMFSLGLMLSLISISSGFDNSANKVNPTDPNDKRQKDYTRENSTKPVDQGGYYGGHDTVTAEAALLKKSVHGDDAIFKDWIDQQALPILRAGAHDEDTNKYLNFYLKDPPLVNGEWGNFLSTLG